MEDRFFIGEKKRDTLRNNYSEVENGVVVPMKQQTERFPSDYSQRIYGYGGLMPRFASKEKRGAGFSSPMFVYRWEMMRELLELRAQPFGLGPEGLVLDVECRMAREQLLERADVAPVRVGRPGADVRAGGDEAGEDLRAEVALADGRDLVEDRGAGDGALSRGRRPGPGFGEALRRGDARRGAALSAAVALAQREQERGRGESARALWRAL